MTTYELPEGMTAAEVAAEKLRSAAALIRGNVAETVTCWACAAQDLDAWADAIDPPKPEPAVSPPPPSLAVGEKVDCPTCGMSWIQCCEHRSKGLDNCCMACDEVGQRRNHTLQEGDGDDAELDALCTDIALEVVKRERDRWQKDCLVAEANEHRLAERLATAEAEVRRLTHLLGSHADGHRCTCTLVRPGNHQEPDEWEQDPMCPTHMDSGYVTRRLAMAEGLLRRATGGVFDAIWCVGGEDEYGNVDINIDITPDETKYLRSLDGEGDSDE